MGYKRIVKVEYADKMPFDRNGVHATGRVITYEYLEDCYCFPKGSREEWYEYEDDSTVEYSDEELLEDAES